MPLPDLDHRFFENTAWPYRTHGNVVGDSPRFISGSADILTSIKGYLERRPGFAAHTADTFTASDIKRIFTWERWDGEFFVFISVVTATDSNVYKQRIGTDATFVLLYNDTSWQSPWEFTSSNNYVFMTNGNESWKYDGTNPVAPWGIGMNPSFQPTAALTGTGITAINGGFRYKYVFYNSTSGHSSLPSLESVVTGNFADKTVEVTCPRTTDTQVDKIRVFRTTDGGGGIWYEITGSPFTHTPGAGNEVVSDTTEDDDLSTVRCPVGDINDYPANIYDPTWYANRIWAFKNNLVVFSGWEEVDSDTSVEEECFPTSNYWPFGSKITALERSEAGLLVFTADEVWRIEGDSLETFSRKLIFTRAGARNSNVVTNNGKVVAWLDVSNTIRVTDGVAWKELSVDIRPDLDGIVHGSASLTFHTDGPRQWLVLMDGGNSKLYVFDLDTEQWMPPWTGLADSSCVYSGQVAAGTFRLFYAAQTNGVLYYMTPSVYTQAGASYAAAIETNLFDIVPDKDPMGLGIAELIGIERNDVAPATIELLEDDDPTQVAHTAMTANKVDAPLRTQGTKILDEWCYVRPGGAAGTQAARRVSARITWSAAATNFKLFSLNLSYLRVR